MVAARFERVAGSFRVLCMSATAACLLVLFGCQPAAGNAPANGSNAPSNEANAGNAPATESGKVAEPKEARYPHQVIAALAKVYLQYGIIDEALRLYDLAIVQQLKQTNTEDAENWIGLADALVKAKEAQKASQA